MRPSILETLEIDMLVDICTPYSVLRLNIRPIGATLLTSKPLGVVTLGLDLYERWKNSADGLKLMGIDRARGRERWELIGRLSTVLRTGYPTRQCTVHAAQDNFDIIVYD
jgi:hypothetical protein